MAKLSWSLILLVLLFNQCTDVKKQPTESKSTDPHSFSLPDDARVKHLSWKATVDFDAKVINAVATWDIEHADDADLIIFDTKGLNIKKVTAADGKPLEYRLAEPDIRIEAYPGRHEQSPKPEVRVHLLTCASGYF